MCQGDRCAMQERLWARWSQEDLGGGSKSIQADTATPRRPNLQAMPQVSAVRIDLHIMLCTFPAWQYLLTVCAGCFKRLLTWNTHNAYRFVNMKGCVFTVARASALLHQGCSMQAACKRAARMLHSVVIIHLSWNIDDACRRRISF